MIFYCAVLLRFETHEAPLARVHEGFGHPFPVLLREVQAPLPQRLKPIAFDRVDRPCAPGD